MTSETKGVRQLREDEDRVIHILSQVIRKIGEELGEEWKPAAGIVKDYVISEGARRGRAMLEEAIKHFSNSDIDVAGRILQEVEDGKRPKLGEE